MKPTDNTTSCTRRIMQTLAVCAGVLIVGACSTTKRIPEGEQLYTGIKKIDITAPEGDKVPEGVAGQITEAVGVRQTTRYSSHRNTDGLSLWGCGSTTTGTIRAKESSTGSTTNLCLSRYWCQT